MLFSHFNRKWISGIMIILACACLFIMVISFLYIHNFIRQARQAQGCIIQLVDREEDGGTSYYPVFTFKDANGVKHIVYSDTGSYPPTYQIGDKITVLYNPNNPRYAKINNFFSIWIIPLITGVLGVTYLPIGLIMWYWPSIIACFKR